MRTHHPSIKVVHWCLDTYPDMETIAGLDVDGFLTNSRTLVRTLGKVAPTFYVPLAADSNVMAPVSTREEYAHPVVYLGQASLTKHRLLEVLTELSPLGLAIYGLGWDRFGSDPLVTPLLKHWKGVLPKDDISALYSTASVVVGTTETEQRHLGMVNNRVFEALSCGAVFLSDHFQALDDLVGGVVAYHRDPGDAFAAATALLARNASARSQAREVGRAHVLAAHTYDHRVESFLPFLQGLPPTRPNKPSILVLYSGHGDGVSGVDLDLGLLLGLLPALRHLDDHYRVELGRGDLSDAELHDALQRHSLVLFRGYWEESLCRQLARVATFRRVEGSRGDRWSWRGAVGLSLRGSLPTAPPPLEADLLAFDIVLRPPPETGAMAHPNELDGLTVSVREMREGSEGWDDPGVIRWENAGLWGSAPDLCGMPRAAVFVPLGSLSRSLPGGAAWAVELERHSVCEVEVVYVARPERLPALLRLTGTFHVSDLGVDAEAARVVLVAALAAGTTVSAPPGPLAALLHREVSFANTNAVPLGALDCPAFSARLLPALEAAVAGPRAAASVAIVRPIDGEVLSRAACLARAGSVHVSVALEAFRVPDDGMWCLRAGGVEAACFGDASFDVEVASDCQSPLAIDAVLRGIDLESPLVFFHSKQVSATFV